MRSTNSRNTSSRCSSPSHFTISPKCSSMFLSTRPTPPPTMITSPRNSIPKRRTQPIRASSISLNSKYPWYPIYPTTTTSSNRKNLPNQLTSGERSTDAWKIRLKIYPRTLERASFPSSKRIRKRYEACCSNTSYHLTASKLWWNPKRRLSIPLPICEDCGPTKSMENAWELLAIYFSGVIRWTIFSIRGLATIQVT
jgi:hypothetical protein